MLALAHGAMPERIACATVDHGLRAEAADEAAMVARLCAGLGLPHATLRPEPPLARGANVQARARAARYDLLADHARGTGCAAILTGHHADDQAETLLMRASRGSGVDGLAGVRAAGDWAGMPLLRPLLGWRRAELAAIVEAAGLDPADDPANRDPAHDRSRFRALIAASGDLDPAGLARSAGALADASEALRWSLDRLAAERITVDGNARTIDPAGLPREYLRRLLVRALAELGEEAPRGPALDRLIAALEAGGSGTLGGVKAERARAGWRVAAAPPRRHPH
ncbi:tRNA lysidine(34) synthetase TilS [Sphingomonas gilva]|uniref:tRNA(Ile)-lysidine synthase n=2 Tax=Sphingomonas gilva TaxID=2305907 RepID=A0A396RKX1_9SPHN|nr:tRNA lysidine(34) synthetase TilS [Sphingomonas gilva]